MRAHPALSALAGALLCTGTLSAQLTTPLDSATLASFRWRNIGPLRGGRTKAAAGIASQPNVFYVGAGEQSPQEILGRLRAGCDAVKFQKRTPELCVPKDQWEKPRLAMGCSAPASRAAGAG